MLEKLRKPHFDNEEEKVHLLKESIVGRRKSQIRRYLLGCDSVSEVFQCLDVHYSHIYPAIQRFLEQLKKLSSHPNESQENENIQKIIHFLRIIKRNKLKLPLNFMFTFANKLTIENHKRILEEEMDLNDVEKLSKVLYKMQETNVKMIVTPGKKVPGVTDEKKKVISMLSRIRKKCYDLIQKGNREKSIYYAEHYRIQVLRYMKRWKITKDHEQKWFMKIEKTTKDSFQLTFSPHIVGMKANNGEEKNNVVNDVSETVDDVYEENDVSNDVEEKNRSEIVVDLRDEDNPKDDDEDDHATSLEECSIDVEVQEGSDENILNLPNVPDEIPGDIPHEDKDEVLHARLRVLKKFRQKHEKKKVVLKEANYMPKQCAGAKRIPFYPANHKPVTDHSLATTSSGLHVTDEGEKTVKKCPYEEKIESYAPLNGPILCGLQSAQSDLEKVMLHSKFRKKRVFEDEKESLDLIEIPMPCLPDADKKTGSYGQQYSCMPRDRPVYAWS